MHESFSGITLCNMLSKTDVLNGEAGRGNADSVAPEIAELQNSLNGQVTKFTTADEEIWCDHN